jgi:hypothetical protein
MRTFRLAAPVVCAVALACGDPAAPTVADLAGSYSATTLTWQDSTGTTNWLAQGSSLSIVLMANDSTRGRLFVPGGDENGADLEADLAGSWVLRGDTVEFDQAADTFVRDMPFVFAGGKLAGQATFSGGTVRVVMVKQ